MEEGRIYFRAKCPYFFHGMRSLIPYETTRVPTCAITIGGVMLYNPNYFARLTGLQVATRMWHELHHWLRKSHARLLGVNPRTSNICCDLGINGSGEEEGGWDFGPDGILPSDYGLPNGLTAEEYLARLPENPSLPQKGGQKQKKQQSGDGDEDDQGDGQSDEPWGGKCGSGAGNPADEAFEAEIDRKLGRSEADKQIIEAQVARDILEHEKTAGKIPGSWSEWAEARLVTPKVPWTQTFQNVVRQCSGAIRGSGGGDYSIRHPSSRSYIGPAGPLKPGLVDQELEIMQVIDTSGSMDLMRQIVPALQESQAAILAAGVDDCWFVEIDAAEQSVPRRVRAQDLAKIEIKGRGGTSFIPAFDIAQKLKPKPDILIYHTDGFGPAPRNPPQGIVTIWCLIGQSTVPAEWGFVVKVED